jgi:uncharacterized protein YkwD
LKKTVLVLLCIAIILGAFFILYEKFPNIMNIQNLFPETSTSTSIPNPPSTLTSSSTPTISSKPYLTSTPTTTRPLTQEELVEYVLSLINADRQQNGAENVTLSNINSGQLHADDMLKKCYFSHWDMNSYKPYVRYTFAGGQGAISENCAYESETGNILAIDVNASLKRMEYNMMYNDAGSNWGHKENILDPFHNKVSIGIAYDHNSVYLVQDFEDDYVQWTTLSSSGNHVQMSGTITETNLTISQVSIYYDSVSNLTVQQLSNPIYQDGYDSGTSVGSVVPTGWRAGEGITISAQTWSQLGQNFDVTFDLSSAFAHSGIGVYTLYLWTNSNNYLTTYSILNTGT